MLIAYGAGGTWRTPLVRALLGPFLAHTRLVYERLARQVAAHVADYQQNGLEVVGVIGIAGSPSCGVHTTLDLPAAVDVLRHCPLAQLDRRMLTERVVGAGRGLFITALQRQLAKRRTAVRFEEYDFATTS